MSLKKAKFQKAGLELWFRIEVEHNLFAGFCLGLIKKQLKDGFSKGYQVDDITDGLKQEASRYLKKGNNSAGGLVVCLVLSERKTPLRRGRSAGF